MEQTILRAMERFEPNIVLRSFFTSGDPIYRALSKNPKLIYYLAGYTMVHRGLTATLRVQYRNQTVPSS